MSIGTSLQTIKETDAINFQKTEPLSSFSEFDKLKHFTYRIGSLIQLKHTKIIWRHKVKFKRSKHKKKVFNIYCQLTDNVSVWCKSKNNVMQNDIVMEIIYKKYLYHAKVVRVYRFPCRAAFTKHKKFFSNNFFDGLNLNGVGNVSKFKNSWIF